MPEAARVSDLTTHGPPMNPGPGSPDIKIGYLAAWRALPASVGAALESVSKKMDSFMTESVLTPASAGPKLAQVSAGLTQTAGKAGAEGNAAASGAATGANATLTSTNVTLSATWTTASAAPGGQPAANTAYTEGIKAAAAAAASAVFSAVGGMTDTHVCTILVPIPPHGPGMVTQASTTVVFNNLPACRKDDKIFEACGGADPISKGEPTVLIGDDTGSGDEAALSFEDQQAQEAEELEALTSEEAPAEALVVEDTYAAAAYSGTPLVGRCKPCDGV